MFEADVDVVEAVMTAAEATEELEERRRVANGSGCVLVGSVACAILGWVVAFVPSGVTDVVGLDGFARTLALACCGGCFVGD